MNNKTLSLRFVFVFHAVEHLSRRFQPPKSLVSFLRELLGGFCGCVGGGRQLTLTEQGVLENPERGHCIVSWAGRQGEGTVLMELGVWIVVGLLGWLMGRAEPRSADKEAPDSKSWEWITDLGKVFISHERGRGEGPGGNTKYPADCESLGGGEVKFVPSYNDGVTLAVDFQVKLNNSSSQEFYNPLPFVLPNLPGRCKKKMHVYICLLELNTSWLYFMKWPSKTHLAP